MYRRRRVDEHTWDYLGEEETEDFVSSSHDTDMELQKETTDYRCEMADKREVFGKAEAMGDNIESLVDREMRGTKSLSKETNCNFLTKKDVESCDVNEYVVKVRVDNPETMNGSIGKPFTLYRVQAITNSGHCFTTRKRYNEFSLLHKMLITAMPGVPIASLPERQTIGRFEKEFIEIRMRGLEMYLIQLIYNSTLKRHKIVNQWFRLEDAEIEALKQSVSQMDCSEMLNQYTESIRTIDVSPIPDGYNKSNMIKQYVRHKLQSLNSIDSQLCNIIKQSESIVDSYLSLSNSYRSIHSCERSLYKDSVFEIHPRISMDFYFESEASTKDELGHFRRIRENIVFDRKCTENIMNGIGSLDLLIANKRNEEERLAQLETTYRKLQSGLGDNSIVSLFIRQDYVTQNRKMIADMGMSNKKLKTLTAWETIATDVLFYHFNKYLQQQRVLHDMAANEFAAKHHEIFIKKANVWNELLQNQCETQNESNNH